MNKFTQSDDYRRDELIRNKSHIFGNLLGLLLFSFLMTVASLSTFAQQTIKISGRVTDFNDKPISNCAVMLMDGHFNAIDSVVTDSVGLPTKI